MNLTYRDIVEILQIVDASGFSQLTIEDGSFRLSISRGPNGSTMDLITEQAAAPQLAAPISSEPAPAAAVSPPSSDGSSPASAPRRVSVGGLELSVSQPSEPVQVSATAVPVPSPMLGVFYRRPSPESPPYVEVGSRVAEGDTLCLVESMKMFMPVQAPVAGIVAAIAVENKALVEFNQPLMWIEPEAAP